MNRFITLNRRDYRALLISALLITVLTCAWIALVANSFALPKRKGGSGSEEIHLGLNVGNSSWSDRVEDEIVIRSSNSDDLSVEHIVFGIAGSAKLWPARMEFIRLWWRPRQMRGFVWHEDPVNPKLWDSGLPRIRISEDTSTFRYTNVDGYPAGIRIARIVVETMRMNLTEFQWLVLCDDDTVFSVDNLVRVLGKYDASQMYYIGSVSESHGQNVAFSHKMAFGGGGIAISYPLALALARMEDKCLEHYPQLTGSDDRLYACIAELGVPLTREAGFHQMDIYGNPLGILSAHPIAPFVSIHHLEAMDPAFPEHTRLESMRKLVKAIHTDASNFLQQTMGYDHKNKLTFSISTGYVVQVFQEIVTPRVLEKAEITFRAWNKKNGNTDFDFDTRKAKIGPPFLFFLNDTFIDDNGNAVGEYTLYTPPTKECKQYCWPRMLFPGYGRYRYFDFEIIRVLTKPLSSSWYKVPRRQCCRLGEMVDGVLSITISPCKPGETLVNR